MADRKPIVLPYICGVARRNWRMLKCKPCAHEFWYSVPSACNYRWFNLFMRHDIICPNCGNKDLPRVLIFDVNDEYDFKPII